MARSDLLINLLRAGTRGDQAMFRRTAEALIAEERAKKHEVLADQLAEQLRSQNGGRGGQQQAGFVESTPDLITAIKPRRSLSDLVLPSHLLIACEELIEE